MKSFSFPLRLRYLSPLLALAVLLTLPSPPATAGKYVYEEEIPLTLKIKYDEDSNIDGVSLVGLSDVASTSDTEKVLPSQPETTPSNEPADGEPQTQPETTPSDEPADGEPQTQPETTPSNDPADGEPQTQPETTPSDEAADGVPQPQPEAGEPENNGTAASGLEEGQGTPTSEDTP